MRIKSKINVGNCFKERNPSNQVSIWNILYIIYIWIERVVDRPREVTSKKIPKFLVCSDGDSFDKEAGWGSEPGE